VLSIKNAIFIDYALKIVAFSLRVGRSFNWYEFCMDKEMKSIFKRNIVKFIVGSILLFACYRYVQQYPAEKIAITSGFEVMVQKVQISFDGFFNHNADAVKSKFDYEKAYDELINIAEGNGCTDTSLIWEMKQTLIDFKAESNSTISNTLPWYIRKANEFKTRVSQQCKKVK